MLAKIKQKRADNSILKNFADKQELVNFGSISNSDQIERIKGVTFSHDSIDKTHMHGNVRGHEVTFLRRTANHSVDLHNSSEYDWTVVNIKIETGGLPHIIFDNKKHDKHFYKSVFSRFPKLRVGNDLLNEINPTAEHQFDMYISPSDSLSVTNLFSDEILQRMSQYYSKFDVEVYSNNVSVFSRGKPKSIMQLNEMLEEAIWLSQRIENRASYEPSEAKTELNLVTA